MNTKTVLFALFLLLPALSMTIDAQPLTSPNGTNLGTVGRNVFDSTTVSTSYTITRPVNTAYYDIYSTLYVRNIPIASSVLINPDYSGSDTSYLELMLTRTTSSLGRTYETIVPYSLLLADSTCYNSAGAGGSACDGINYRAENIRIRFLSDLTSASETFNVYVGGSYNMGRVQSNATYKWNGAILVPFGSDVWHNRAYFNATSRTAYFTDEDHNVSTAWDTKWVIPSGYDYADVYSSKYSNLSMREYFGAKTCTQVWVDDEYTYTSKYDPVGFTILASGCNPLGIGGSGGAQYIEFSPNGMQNTIYTAGGSPSCSYTTCPSIGHPPVANNNIQVSGNIYRGVGIGLAEGSNSWTRTNVTYYNNSTISSLITATYLGTPSEQSYSIMGFPTGGIGYETGNFSTIIKGTYTTGAYNVWPERTAYLQPKSALTSVEYVEYYKYVWDRLYSNNFASMDMASNAIGSVSGRMDKTVYFSSFTELCDAPVVSDCDGLQPRNGLPFYGTNLTCIDSTDIGFYDSCGNAVSCMTCSSCTVDSPQTKIQCGSTCYGTSLDRYCKNGKSYITYSCDTAEHLDEDCYGGSCANGYCASSSTLIYTGFAAMTHDRLRMLNGVTVNITGSTVQNEDYTASCTTNEYSGYACSVPLVPGRYKFTGNRTGFQIGAEKCVGAQDGASYAEGCIFQVATSNTILFSMLNDTQSSNETALRIETRRMTNIVEGVSINFTIGDDEYLKISDMNGIANIVFDAAGLTGTICVDKTGYISSCETISINLGKDNYHTVFMGQDTHMNITNGMIGAPTRIFAQGYISDKLTVPISVDMPGKITVSRADVIVYPCADQLCNEHEKLGLNALMVFGPGDDSVIVYDADTGHLLDIARSRPDKSGGNGFNAGDEVTAQDILCGNDNKLSVCTGLTSQSLTYHTSTGSEYSTPKMFLSSNCSFQGKHYMVILLPSIQNKGYMDIMKPILDNAATIWNTTIFNEGVQSISSLMNIMTPSGRSLASLTQATVEEMCSSNNQDLITDYVIFNVDYAKIWSWITSNKKQLVSVQGSIMNDYAYNIMVNPIYSPLLRTGKDPLILENGLENYLVRSTGGPSDYDSFGLDNGKGIERQDWRAEIMTKNVNASSTFFFNYKLSDLTQDVKYDLQTGKYASASLKYFGDNFDIVSAPIDSLKFKTDIFLEIKFTPSDTNYPPTYEYVKAIAFIDTSNGSEFGIYIGAALIAALFFLPALLLILKTVRG